MSAVAEAERPAGRSRLASRRGRFVPTHRPALTRKATLYAVGLVNALATFVAVAGVDHFGRKLLLFTGLVGMGTRLTHPPRAHGPEVGA